MEWSFRPNFFVLSQEGLKNLEEQYWLLIYHTNGGFNHEVIDAMPIYSRIRYVERLLKQKNEERLAMQQAMAK